MTSKSLESFVNTFTDDHNHSKWTRLYSNNKKTCQNPHFFETFRRYLFTFSRHYIFNTFYFFCGYISLNSSKISANVCQFFLSEIIRWFMITSLWKFDLSYIIDSPDFYWILKLYTFILSFPKILFRRNYWYISINVKISQMWISREIGQFIKRGFYFSKHLSVFWNLQV